MRYKVNYNGNMDYELADDNGITSREFSNSNRNESRRKKSLPRILYK